MDIKRSYGTPTTAKVEEGEKYKCFKNERKYLVSVLQ